MIWHAAILLTLALCVIGSGVEFVRARRPLQPIRMGSALWSGAGWLSMLLGRCLPAPEHFGRGAFSDALLAASLALTFVGLTAALRGTALGRKIPDDAQRNGPTA